MMGKLKVNPDEIRLFIQGNFREHPRDIVHLTQERFNLTRPSVLHYINDLINEKKILVKGRTKDREYFPVPMTEKTARYVIDKKLDEGSIWMEFSPLLADVSSNVRNICQYGFTEMVNNAIEHSQGTILTIMLSVFFDQIEILITDNGVGIFNKIQKQYGLSDPIHSILELAKGKLTTDPKKHSGEGIFFTSRIFDCFYVKSENIGFIHTKSGFDYINQGGNSTSGTIIEMEIQTTTKKNLHEVFDQFSNADDDFGFSKTIVPIHLALFGDDQLISRSQARRVLTRFDRFKHVILDFKDVRIIGQSFADEIFRVFQSEHPEILLSYRDANKNVEKMILHARQNP